MQTICTLLQTDNHINTWSFNFYRPDALPDAQPTVSKHWRQHYNDTTTIIITLTHTHPFNGPFPGLPRWAGTRKAKPIWILLKQQTVSGSGISWNICKSAPRSRQITTPTPHHSVFYRPYALPATPPIASKHWRHKLLHWQCRQKHYLQRIVTNSWAGIAITFL